MTASAQMAVSGSMGSLEDLGASYHEEMDDNITAVPVRAPKSEA